MHSPRPIVVDILFEITVLGLVLAGLISWLWRRSRSKHAVHWPTAEASINSGSIEMVAHSRYGTLELPVFTFSYHVSGEYFGGRFALRPYITDPGASVVQRMIGRKLLVHYEPQQPSTWFIADELIEGCKVEQDLSPDLVNFKPLS